MRHHFYAILVSQFESDNIKQSDNVRYKSAQNSRRVGLNWHDNSSILLQAYIFRLLQPNFALLLNFTCFSSCGGLEWVSPLPRLIQLKSAVYASLISGQSIKM